MKINTLCGIPPVLPEFPAVSHSKTAGGHTITHFIVTTMKTAEIYKVTAKSRTITPHVPPEQKVHMSLIKFSDEDER